MSLDPKEVYLAVSCSSSLGSLALAHNGQVWSQTNPDQLRHSDFISTAFQNLSQSAGIPASRVTQIILDIGPGSFTGVRVGVSFAKALAFVGDQPILTLHSLDLIAPGHTGVRALNAYRNSAYVQKGTPDSTPELLKIEAFQEYILSLPDKKIPLMGDLIEAYSAFWSAEFTNKVQVPTHINHQSILNSHLALKDLRPETLPLHLPHALGLIYLLDQSIKKFTPTDWRGLHPFYMRSSSAEEVRNEAQGFSK